ncbi:MAG: histidine phosphatase family protein [Actinomycetota bacterium]
MERVILARHGESEASAVGLVNGDPERPVHLTERGRKEARRLGERLATEPIDLCVVTAFPRTQETADVALGDRDVPRLVLTNLNDPLAGVLEGSSIAVFRDWFRSAQATTRVPEGESRVETVKRYVDGFRAVAARSERTILVVAHGLTITYALIASRGEDLPLTLEGVQVDHATPFPLGRDELLRAVEVMAAWVARQGAAA